MVVNRRTELDGWFINFDINYAANIVLIHKINKLIALF